MKALARVLVLSLVVLGISTSAFATTFLQFNEIVFNNPFVLTNVGGASTTLTATTNVNVTFDPSFCLVPGCGGATNGVYALSLSAANTGAASLSGGIVTQDFGGTLSLTQGLFNLLTINFSDTLSGALGGSNPVLQSSDPPDTFSGSSNVLDPLKLQVPRGFSLSFSNLGGGGLGIVGTSIRSGTGDATGTFNATQAVPEPTSMLLLGTGLLVGARKLRNRKR